MKVGDLVKHNLGIGVVTLLWDPSDWYDDIDLFISVLFGDGEFDVLAKNEVVISESR